jgi:membrane fusion protein, adhesin transport system
MKKDNSKNLSARDYEFMHSLSAAVIQVTPSKLRAVLYFWLIAIFTFLVWANFAYIDEIARGDGEIVPSGQNQMIQNLEGGIVKEILVQEGQEVEKGQILLKIDNQKSESSLTTNAIKADALEAKIARLQAESTGAKFQVSKELEEKIPLFVDNEKSLYLTNQKQLQSKIGALKEKLEQKRQELSEAKARKRHLRESLAFINKEVEMTQPMVAKGIRSKIDFLKLQREQNEAKEKYSATNYTIPRLESAIKEVQSTIKETNLLFQSDAKAKLNEATAELRGYRANSTALEDQVTRTVVRSPMKGIVQKLYVHTVGGVIQPGADIIEIVPTDENLIVEAKIKPSDIAFIYYGQKAIVKFSAYDFAIYGGLDGKVILISPDTIKDEKDNVFYTVRIQTNQNFLGDKKKPLKIIPGMTVSVDIITGQKSVLDYILKPILKTKQYTFSER